MRSLLLIATDKTKREAYAQTFCDTEQISAIDRMIVSRETADKKESKREMMSIGIDQIKRIQEKLYLKPLQSKKKAVIILDAHLLTTEAQNAMLKILEEPPEDTSIILVSEKRDVLLPTILSRCLVIDLGTQKELTENEGYEYEQIVQVFATLAIADALKLAESLSKQKDTGLEWLEKTTLHLRNKLLAEEILIQRRYYFQLLSLFQETYGIVKTTNVNLRFALETLLLSVTQLPHPS